MLDYTQAIGSAFVDKVLQISGAMLGSAKDAATTAAGRAFESIQPLGLLARPRDPDADSNGNATKGAGLLTLLLGSSAFGMPTTDPRAVAKVPPVKKGGTALYSYPGGCVTLDGDNGAILALGPTADGKKNHAISIDSKNDCISIRMANGAGIQLENDADGHITINSPNGKVSLTISNNGIVASGPFQHAGGFAAGLQAPAGPPPQSPALAPALQAWETALAAMVPAFADAANTLAPGSVTLLQLAAFAQATIVATGVAGKSSKVSLAP